VELVTLLNKKKIKILTKKKVIKRKEIKKKVIKKEIDFLERKDSLNL